MKYSDLLRHLDLQTFVAFDFETTGLDPQLDRIIEFAAIRYKEGEIVNRYDTLVNPQIPIPSNITNITGITSEMVADSPREEDIITDIFEFLGNDPIVAHNIDFDYNFLKALKERYSLENVEISNPLFDTLVLAQTFLYFLPNHRLGTVAEYFSVPPGGGSHRALADTENVGILFLNLILEACSYSLSVIQKILATIQNFDVPNKELFINIANLLVSEQKLKHSLVKSSIQKPEFNNFFQYHGNSTVIPEKAEDIFGKDGTFAATFKSNDYEVRPYQIEYSDFILKSLENGVIGVAEAGAGLGKSLAYLYPALKISLEKEEGPSVISCHTKHLQDQLFYQELPKLAQALDVSFSATMMKGRQNYLCKTRLDWVIADARSMLSKYEVLSILPVIVWLQSTKTGDFSECAGFLNRRPGRVKSMICSDVGFCTRQICKNNHGCFVGSLRLKNQQADLIVINQALLLSEIQNPGILPPFHRVIVDEAHNLVKVGYSQYQKTVDRQLIWDSLSLVNPASKVSQRLKKQIEVVGQMEDSLLKQYPDFQTSIESLLIKSKQLFDEMSKLFSRSFDPNVTYEQKLKYKDFEKQFKGVRSLITELIHSIKSGIDQLTMILKKLDQLGEKKVSKDLPVSLRSVEESMEEILTTLMETTINERDDWVYWLSGRYFNDELLISLNAVPIDIGSELLKDIFKPMESVIITSATLKTGKQFDYLISRMGLTENDDLNIQTQVFPSPFYYDEQCEYYQYAGPLLPTSDDFPGFICDLVTLLNQRWKKRIMVLFTSRKMIGKCYDEFEHRGLTGKFNLFVQLPPASRNQLLTGFKKSPDGILFGTDSFWEGVDLPKELLEVLIITKLPFDVPNEPIVKAYGELIQNRGGNSFFDFGVPEAAIRLRQGFGRLIRTSFDEGVYINLDSRVINKRYGRLFSEVIPVQMKMFSSIEEFSNNL